MNELKFHPILYSSAMIQAKKDGRKKQTRRIIKARTPESMALLINLHAGVDVYNSKLELGRVYSQWRVGDLLFAKEMHYDYGYWYEDGYTKTGRKKYRFCSTIPASADIRFYDDPPKDILSFSRGVSKTGWYKRSSLFMPCRYARIWERVTAVRVERLQEITPNDAVREGIEYEELTWGPVAFPDGTIDKSIEGKKSRSFRDYLRPNNWLVDNPIGAYRSLWESINGPGSWDENPFVWVITTETLSTTGMPVILIRKEDAHA